MRTVEILLSIFFGIIVVSVLGQQSCCSVTSQFADLGKDTRFLEEHQIPASSIKITQKGKWIEFPTSSGENGRAYINIPANPGNDYLFVFHEWWGLNDYIINESDNWANTLEGVNVMAIDLYDGKVASTREEAAQLMQGASEDRIREIINGAIAYAGGDASIATIGWCFGGGWSMQASLMLEDRATACVIYYGMPEKSAEKLANLHAPVLGIFAEKDQWINHAVVDEYEKAMNTADKSFETLWFNAEHAFANPSNSLFNSDAASKAKATSTKFLSNHLLK